MPPSKIASTAAKIIAVIANGVETRANYGVVLGAVLSSEHRNCALTERPVGQVATRALRSSK